MPLPLALYWQDHAIVVTYLVAMIGLGAHLSHRQRNEEEYFLGSRRMPWFAVGLSVIASLLSSLTYLSEPGEVWQSGVSHFWGKMLAVPLEMLLVWLVIIPFLMRFRYTSAYEYLEQRFNAPARLLGVALFCCLVLAWMGFIVLASSRVLAATSGIPLGLVIATIGIVATVYTVLGGLRAVIWTDVAQVCLLLGGILLVLGYVAFHTHSTPWDWYHTIVHSDVKPLAFFDPDPYVRVTVLTAALSMFVWHICTHTANQMTVQRYFSTSGLRAARRSFVTGSLAGVVLNTLLMLAGLAMFYYYNHGGASLPPGLDPRGKGADQVLPHFVQHQMPAGCAGLLLAAVLAAAMSSIDSGINSLATVLTIEWRRWFEGGQRRRDHVLGAKVFTVGMGAVTTLAAYLLDRLPGDDNIVGMMPRTFNCFLTPLAGMFLAGIFLPWVGGRAALAAGLAGMFTSISLAYGKELWGLVGPEGQPLSFTLVLPSSLAVALLTAALVGVVDRASAESTRGLTWRRTMPADPQHD